VRYGAALVAVPLDCGGGGVSLVSLLRGLISQAENLFRKDTLMRESGSELPAGNGNGFPPSLHVPSSRAWSTCSLYRMVSTARRFRGFVSLWPH
jgi:hypothetical protein